MDLACPSIRRFVSFVQLLTLEEKDIERPKLVRKFPRAGLTSVPIFGLKGQRSRSPDVKNLQKMTHLA